ncbi:MAG: hypothetical protein SWJ54_15575 [Cyanobacteriota bacterium]|nr:hypothetical protein [Cyanobacteriota bacterium]
MKEFLKKLRSRGTSYIQQSSSSKSSQSLKYRGQEYADRGSAYSKKQTSTNNQRSAPTKLTYRGISYSRNNAGVVTVDTTQKIDYWFSGKQKSSKTRLPRKTQLPRKTRLPRKTQLPSSTQE